MASEEEIEVGSLVMLRSGSPLMTVDKLYYEEADEEWRCKVVYSIGGRFSVSASDVALRALRLQVEDASDG